MVKEMKNRRGKGKIKLNYISFVVITFIIFAVIAVAFYLILQFKTGDFVYNKDTGLIGEVKGVALPLDYLVQWQDGSFSQESLFKIEKLKELSDAEVMELLEKDNQEYRFYPGQTKGEGLILENVTEVKEMSIGKIVILSSGGVGEKEFVLRIGEENCEPRFICGKWSKCQTKSDLYSLVTEEFSGIQYRYCRDYSKCVSDFIDSRKCDAKVPIDIKRVIFEGEEYIEIYDKENNKLIAKMKEEQLANFKKLNIEIVV